ncbi:MAG TPA: hypothetical protein ENF96_00445 [Archaeoglobus veneficus]|nr:hypothetical protein [Archaeoglobus veneficus]
MNSILDRFLLAKPVRVVEFPTLVGLGHWDVTALGKFFDFYSSNYLYDAYDFSQSERRSFTGKIWERPRGLYETQWRFIPKVF